MQLIVGLGNPGLKYQKTRHNVGFMLVNYLWQKYFSESIWKEDKKFQAVFCQPQEYDLMLAKGIGFMNESGETVSKLANFYKIKPDEIVVIHDDLDLSLGEYKIQKGVGPKLHYGILSVEEKLGNPDFWRVRIGVDNRSKESRTPGETYVLQEFTDSELQTLNKVIIKATEDIKIKLLQYEND